MPAKAGIQAILLDSRQEHAGMTTRDNGHFILWNCTRGDSPTALGGKGQWMDWDGVAGNWRQWKGNVRETWGRLTGNELCILAGRRDQLLGRIQACCGIKPEEAEEELKEWGVL